MSQFSQRASLQGQPEGDCDNSSVMENEIGPIAGAVSSSSNSDQRSAVSQSQMGWLVSTIEDNILPRLMQTLGAKPASKRGFAALDRNTVPELARLVLSDDAQAAARLVARLRADGVPLETIYLDVLAPAARHLGERWEQDLTDFTDVTIGLWRLQQLMYELSPAFQDDARHGALLHRIMLVPVPGSQHTLGLLMVAEFFRRAGWVVWGDPAATIGDLTHAVRAQWFDMAGFSMGTETQCDVLKKTIASVRKASLNPSMTIMVGGPVFIEKPELVERVGADATAADAAQAVEHAASLLARSRQAE
jgi:MerR family transcriptional regulator, light-induced transcriptional regulator